MGILEGRENAQHMFSFILVLTFVFHLCTNEVILLIKIVDAISSNRVLTLQ